MQAVRYFNVKIRRSELATFVEDYPAWECPLLEALHPEFEIVKEFIHTREVPEANDEFARLENRYPRTLNEDGSKGPPLVHIVYGAHQIGRKNLAEAINASIVSTDTSDLLGSASGETAAA